MSETSQGVAIVGMAGRFPGARNVDDFWRNIKDGVDSISRFSPETLETSGPKDDAGKFVCAKGLLDDIDKFDARFFGYLPKEAEVMDPQHRIFLEICWEAMEHAGYDPGRVPGAVGVFGGCYMDTYVFNNLCANEESLRDLVESMQVGSLQTELGNDKDYLATRVAFKLGLRGPAMTLQTACSTSLVAIAAACQNIETYQCDMALAGGVTIVLPQRKGYAYKEGGMLSPDGRCRPFDADAAGTVFSNGAAVVLLKRAEDAIRDGDVIYGVIKGYATNNDGGDKLSYTAPSVDGQAEVISLALGMGGVDARSIGYVEAHGTATPLGDPIEAAGLTKAFRSMTDDSGYCALGSVKANLGHLDCASGAVGLIKTALSLHEKTLPPLLHFRSPNPKIDFDATPFYVNTELKHWDADGPRRAGVSSFGVGGTNAHIVVEEGPPASLDQTRRPCELIVLSARSHAALNQQTENLAQFLEMQRDVDFADAAHTLRIGRRAFEHRRFVVAADKAEAKKKLRAAMTIGESASLSVSSPEVVFMFPGQGAQFPGMGRELYFNEPIYRQTVDCIAEAVLADDGARRDIRDFLLWSDALDASYEAVSADLANTENAQVALYAIECGLSALLRSWGVVPAGVIGHSIGECAAAWTAGVFSLEDGARLVAARGRAMQAQPAGQMLAVLASADTIVSALAPDIVVSAVNAPGACVLSGPTAAIGRLAERLENDGTPAKILNTSHAFHSPMMAGAKDPLIAAARDIALSPATLDCYSTMLGARAPAGAFADPTYWGEGLMAPVRFRDALAAAADDDKPQIFVELGPGGTLTGFTARTLPGANAFAALGALSSTRTESASMMQLMGELWTHGVSPDWEAFSVGRRRRTPLPTYPFERKRYWIEPIRKPKSVPIGLENGADEPPTEGRSTEIQDVDGLIDRQLDVIADQLKILKGL